MRQDSWSASAVRFNNDSFDQQTQPTTWRNTSVSVVSTCVVAVVTGDRSVAQLCVRLCDIGCSFCEVYRNLNNSSSSSSKVHWCGTIPFPLLSDILTATRRTWILHTTPIQHETLILHIENLAINYCLSIHICGGCNNKPEALYQNLCRRESVRWSHSILEMSVYSG